MAASRGVSGRKGAGLKTHCPRLRELSLSWLVMPLVASLRAPAPDEVGMLFSAPREAQLLTFLAMRRQRLRGIVPREAAGQQNSRRGNEWSGARKSLVGCPPSKSPARQSVVPPRRCALKPPPSRSPLPALSSLPRFASGLLPVCSLRREMGAHSAQAPRSPEGDGGLGALAGVNTNPARA